MCAWSIIQRCDLGSNPRPSIGQVVLEQGESLKDKTSAISWFSAAVVGDLSSSLSLPLSITMKMPEFEVENTSDDENLESRTDDAIQDVYEAARDAIQKHLGVEVDAPTGHIVAFRYDGAEVNLYYAKTGNESFRVVDQSGIDQEVSEEEFTEKVDDKILLRLKKAIGIYANIVKSQQSFVSQEVLEARYT